MQWCICHGSLNCTYAFNYVIEARDNIQMGTRYILFLSHEIKGIYVTLHLELSSTIIIEYGYELHR